ncbi:hypothetical protein DL95DRAFT_518655 [Leptodontidium sp. 2 PMI_412]|nr:hypothetical protein DL95DRAFT_518655 [Leptodontidium sp. 2 PMI_412]
MDTNKNKKKRGSKSAALSSNTSPDTISHPAASSFAVPATTPSADDADKPLSPDKISVIHDTLCPQADGHTMGVICQVCRTVLMPWFDKLPKFVVNKKALKTGPQGSIVRGVLLQNPEAVAVLTVVANLDMANKKYDEVVGLADIMPYYRKAAAAGIRVADMYRIIFRISTPVHDIPAVADIINAALENPTLTPEEYIGNIKVELAAMAPLRPVYGRSPLLIPASAVSRSLEREASSPQEASSSSDRVPTFSESKRPIVRGNDTHAPPKEKGPWEFVPGSNISGAVLGEPEPHKFFLIRQSINDSSKKDIRQYPSWDTMDWNEPRDIQKFNKWQQQIKDRAADKPASQTKGWTQAEKDFLKQAVEAALARGLTRSNINWDEIAQTLSDRFAKKIQKAGDPMAQATELHKDNTITPSSKRYDRKLKEDRVSIVRTGKGVKTQAMKYGDIALLLRLSKKSKTRGVRDDAGHDADMTEDENDSSREELGSDFRDDMDIRSGSNAQGNVRGGAETKASKAAKSTKGTKRRRSRSPDTTSKRNKTSPKPLPTSAESFAGEVAKISPWFKKKVTQSTPSSEPLDGESI